MTIMDINQIYFEDLEVGQKFETAGRTVTEGDIVTFAGLSGDFNQLHVDEAYASKTIHSGRIAHGMLVLSITSGLCTQIVLNQQLQPSIIGLLGVESKWTKAVKVGDTIHVEIVVKEKRETSKPGRGVVKFERNTYNQNGDMVLTSVWSILLERRQ